MPDLSRRSILGSAGAAALASLLPWRPKPQDIVIASEAPAARAERGFDRDYFPIHPGVGVIDTFGRQYVVNKAVVYPVASEPLVVHAADDFLFPSPVHFGRLLTFSAVPLGLPQASASYREQAKDRAIMRLHSAMAEMSALGL